MLTWWCSPLADAPIMKMSSTGTLAPAANCHFEVSVSWSEVWRASVTWLPLPAFASANHELYCSGV